MAERKKTPLREFGKIVGLSTLGGVALGLLVDAFAVPAGAAAGHPVPMQWALGLVGLVGVSGFLGSAIIGGMHAATLNK